MMLLVILGIVGSLLAVMCVVVMLRPQTISRMVMDRQTTLISTVAEGRSWIAEMQRSAALRIPARLREDSPGAAVKAVLGSGLMAATGLALVLGESSLAIETVCGMLGGSETCSMPAYLPSAGVAFGLSLVAGAIFWGMVGMELIGYTNCSGWIRPDHLEGPRIETDYARRTRAMRRWILPATTVIMFLLSVTLLVALSIFRVAVLEAAPAGGVAQAATTLQSTRGVLQLAMVGGAVLVSVSACFGLLAVKDFLTLVLGGLLFGAWLVFAAIAGFFLDAFGWVGAEAFDLSLDFVELASPRDRRGTAANGTPLDDHLEGRPHFFHDGPFDEWEEEEADRAPFVRA